MWSNYGDGTPVWSIGRVDELRRQACERRLARLFVRRRREI